MFNEEAATTRTPRHEVSQNGPRWGYICERYMQVMELETKDAGFEAFFTADQSLRYQQNLAGSKLRIIVLEAPSNRLEHIGPLLPAAMTALREMAPGELRVIRNPIA